MTEPRHPQRGSHAGRVPTIARSLRSARQVMRRSRSWRSSCSSLLALGAARTVISRMSNAHARRSHAPNAPRSTSRRATPKTGDAGQKLSLPGTLQGFVQAPIAARASGYLKRWHKDIGSRSRRRAAGRDRDARDRPAADAGDRGARAGGLQPGSRPQHRRALGSLRKKDAVSQQELEERRSAQRASAAPTSPPPTPTSSGCASSKASSAWWRRSPA